jgi:aminopeptidase N
VQRVPTLDTVDQLGVLADARALAAVSLVPLELVWNIAHDLPDDAPPQVWSAAADFWVDLHTMLRRNPQPAPSAAQTLAATVGPRLAAKLDTLGWLPAADEAPALTLLREDLLATLSALADQATLRRARELYAQGQGWSSLPPDLRRAVWAMVARHADPATWEQLHQQALREDDPQVRDELFELLATTESGTLAQRALNLTQGSEVGDTHKAALVRAVAVLHPELALDFALSNADAMRKLFDDAGWPEFVSRLTRHTDTVQTETRLRAWATQSLGADGRQTVRRALESLRARRHSRTVMLPALRALLAGTSPTGQSSR